MDTDLIKDNCTSAQNKKVINNCLNLECQNEQLKIIIEKLQKFTINRQKYSNLHFANTVFSKIYNSHFDKFIFAKEMNQVKLQSKQVEETIKKLKEKINEFNDAAKR